MKKIDYIIVGLGIAGIALSEEMEKHGKSFRVYDGGKLGATAKSGGVLNPTVLKRFTAAWNAAEFFPKAIDFYKDLSEKLHLDFFQETPVMRIFKSVEEQNNWSVASDKNELKQFLSSEFIKNTNIEIEAPFGFGEVLKTAKIDATKLLTQYRKYLEDKECLVAENFQYEEVSEDNDAICYKNISAKKIIFAEGAKAIENPFFSQTGIVGNKGEYVVIKASLLKVHYLLKGPMYIIPLGNDTYKVGATYSRDDYSTNPTAEARTEILSKVKTFIKCDFEIVDQIAGVRPTTRDHRPLLGSLKENSNIFFLNGLNSRGYLMAPTLSETLYAHLENKVPLPKEIDIRRVLAWK